METHPRQAMPEGASDRMFGFVMTGFFALLGALPLLTGKPLRAWALVVAALFLLFALARPAALAQLNRGWTRLGLLLGAIVSPVTLAILFFGVITPYGWLMRKAGKNIIPVQFDRTAGSYWIEAPADTPASMKNPF